MRVLLLSGSYPPMKCGVGDYTFQLCQALAETPGTSVGVVTHLMADVDGAPGVEIFPITRKWGIADLSAVIRVVRAWRGDVLHVQYPTQGYRGWLPWFLPILLATQHTPVVQTWHEYFLTERAGVRTTLIALPARDVVVVRPAYRERIAPRFRAIASRLKFHHIPNASAIPRVEMTASEKQGLRHTFAPNGEVILVYFGFLLRHKGPDLLFEIADPARDRLIFIGDIDPQDRYHHSLLRRSHEPDWDGKVLFTGFLPPMEVARLLAIADAVVLPFHDGGGLWNSSIHGAVLQGTFVLTTSSDRAGYSAEENVYYSTIDKPEEMRLALNRYVGHKRSPNARISLPDWRSIAEAHIHLYARLIGGTDPAHG